MFVPQEAIEATAVGPYPNIPAVVFAECFYIIITKAVRRGVLTVEPEFLRARGVYIDTSPMGADPKVPLAVFEEGRYRPLREAGVVARFVFISEERAFGCIE